MAAFEDNGKLSIVVKYLCTIHRIRNHKSAFEDYSGAAGRFVTRCSSFISLLPELLAPGCD